MTERMNLLFVFADQWRAQAFGYAGDPNVSTPNLDAFAAASLNFPNAVSGCPVCSPYRASLMTGVYPHRHRMMVNDQSLPDLYAGPFLADCLKDAGYATAYIGKWHINGNGRLAFVPPERRLGFDWWKGFECTHSYQDSYYYFGNDPRPHPWPGYDADAQTDAACRYLREDAGDQPFALFLSWGPPHNPFGNAPQPFEDMYTPADIRLPPNVSPEIADRARRELAGYYAHCSALDAAFGRLLDTLQDTGLDDRTIVIFTSDHGDMLGAQGCFRKQKPWAESIRVPFLVRHPQGAGPGTETAPIDAPDLMPTLLSLCGIDPPAQCQGRDFSRTIVAGSPADIDAALLALYVPFHEWRRDNGGREFRGLHDERYTYCRTLAGPWLLYDNREDPGQLQNLVDHPDYAELVADLDRQLTTRLQEIGDAFLPGDEYIAQDDIALNENGDILIEPSVLPEPCDA